MKVLVEYEFSKEEIEILCAICDYVLEEVDTPQSILALKHLQEPLLVCQEIMSYGNERKG